MRQTSEQLLRACVFSLSRERLEDIICRIWLCAHGRRVVYIAAERKKCAYNVLVGINFN